MDADRFDRIAKTMGTSNSRRRVLGGLLGALLGTAVVGPAGETLAAPGKRHGKKAENASRRKHDDRQPGDRKRTERGKRGHQPPTPERTDEPTSDVASQEVGIASHGCRHTGATCTRAGQCCSGRCAGNGTCQLCSRVSQCPAPPASQPCKRAVCTGAGKCVIKNKAADTACTSDGNECTDDVCDASGACTHPNTANHTTCSTGTCQDGACEGCLAVKANCTTAEECCQDGGATECAGTGTSVHQCCRPFGGACSTPGQFDECCTGGDLVFCAPNNTCGGTGARCDIGAGCVSGQCCVDFSENGVCCAAGQQCQSGQCVG